MEIEIVLDKWLRNRVYFDREDWDSGLAREVIDVIKKFGRDKRVYNGEERVWYVSDEVVSAINKYREGLRRDLEGMMVDRDIDDFEDIWSK